MDPKNKKIKILRIIARLNIGGPAIHVINLTHYLNDEQFESKLICGQEAAHEGNMLHLAEEKNVHPIVIPELGREISILKDFKIIWKLYKIIRQEKPDIVHTHTAKAGTVGRIAAKLAGIKTIIHTFHGHVLHSYFGKLKTFFFIQIERFLALLTDKIVVISEQQKKELVHYKIAAEDKFLVIPLGFELDKYKNLKRTNYLRNLFNIPDNTKLIGIIGRLTPIKNHQLLIPIMQEVLARFKEPVKLVVVGSGELESELKALVNKHHLEKEILFTGWHKDLTQIY
ncbi:MAG: glycosyltransferase, partial [Candidatus Margulisbacteria bacterium]|nr:glycosyltransferase [Candidatus Margulisiibacteriota bacterium]